MRIFQANYTAANTSFLALSQTSGTGVLTLNPSSTDYRTISGSLININGGEIARPGSLTSTGDMSALNFTFYGTDVYQQPISETVTGPNNTSVYTISQFLTVTGIVANTGFTATSIAAGIGPGGNTVWYTPNRHATPFNVAVAMAVLTNTTFYTIQHTFDDLFNISSFSSVEVFNQSDPTLVNTSSDGQGNYAFPVAGIRASFSTSSSTIGGSAQFYIIQAGIC